MRKFLIFMFYTYLWLRENGTPYYVGKGSGNRAFRWHERIGRSPSRDRIIVQEWPTEEDSFAAEKFLISYYGRKDQGTGCLANLTDGGEGAAGAIPYVRTPEHKQQIQERMAGRVLSEQAKLNMKNAARPPISPEARLKMSIARKGQPHTKEWNERISAAQKGVPRPYARKDNPKSPAQRTREYRERQKLKKAGVSPCPSL